jgi:glycosyltransferase involved in cell wall biosynthesis
MRVLQICSARQLGGGEKHLIDLSNALARRGHDVYAAVAPDSPLLPELTALPQQNITQTPLRNALDLPSALQLTRFVRKHKIEIIHAHVARDYPLAAFAAARNIDTQFVLTRHALFPLNKLHKITLARAARIIAVSAAVARSLRDSRVVDTGKIVVVLNGIDTAKFGGIEAPAFNSNSFHQSRNSDEVALLVGTIGHLGFIKGHEDFVRAAALIAARRTNVKFLIVGEDKSRAGENRVRLEALIRELNLNARVRLGGWTNDAAAALRKFDVFVSAARSEPFGLAIVEAMASGTAVVATMTDGAREIVEDDVTGKLGPIGDIEAMASAIDSLLADKNQRETFGTRARLAARERFSLERMVDATEQIYREALQYAMKAKR